MRAGRVAGMGAITGMPLSSPRLRGGAPAAAGLGRRCVRGPARAMENSSTSATPVGHASPRQGCTCVASRLRRISPMTWCQMPSYVPALPLCPKCCSARNGRPHRRSPPCARLHFDGEEIRTPRAARPPLDWTCGPHTQLTQKLRGTRRPEGGRTAPEFGHYGLIRTPWVNLRVHRSKRRFRAADRPANRPNRPNRPQTEGISRTIPPRRAPRSAPCSAPSPCAGCPRTRRSPARRDRPGRGAPARPRSDRCPPRRRA